MNKRVWLGTACLLLASAWVLVSCSGQPATYDEPAAESESAAEQPAEAESYSEPGAEEATLVQEFVRQWVAQKAGEGRVYDIPARGEHDVSGTLAGFHTVQLSDADTYSVCVDFQDGESTYDVDFFVERSDTGLSVSDHYLHKVNGEAVM